jgi:hydrogenase expression/formation protein HypC
MCVAVPAKITWIGAVSPTSVPGRMVAGGRQRDVDLVMVPGVKVGDYVVVHAGYAIRLLPEHRAREAMDYFEDAAERDLQH